MIRSLTTRTLALSTLAAALAAPAGAQLITPALLEGDLVPGVGNVTTINNIAINGSGSWLVECDTDNANADADVVLVRDGLLYLQEGQALPAPAGATISSFDSINLNENGDSGWNFFLDNTGATTNDSGIYFNTSLLIQESDVSTAPEFTPGTPYIGFFDAKIKPNNSNQILVTASIDDPNIATTVDRALVVLTHDGAGNLVSEQVILKEGDIPPGQVDAITDFGTGPHQTAFNDAGDAMFFLDLNGSTTIDGVIYRNGTIIAQEGTLAPDGRVYTTLASRPLDMANSGAYVFRADVDGATTDDEIVVRNGAIMVREGDSLPGMGGFTLTGFGSGPLEIDNAGHVLWFGDWNDPNLDIDTGLFLDDLLIVQEGVTEVNGIIVDTISGIEDGYKLSDNGMWGIFRATLVGGINAVALLDFTGPVPVRVSHLLAVPQDRRVVLSWETALEVQHDGFHVYRSDAPNGSYVRMTSDLVRGVRTYAWEDRGVEADHTYWYRIGAVALDGSEEFLGPVSVTTPKWLVARSALAPPSPNPLVDRTQLRFTVDREGPVDLAVFDVSGRLVRSLVRGPLAVGEHVSEWDGRAASGAQVPAGVYFSRLTTASRTETQKITVVGVR